MSVQSVCDATAISVLQYNYMKYILIKRKLIKQKKKTEVRNLISLSFLHNFKEEEEKLRVIPELIRRPLPSQGLKKRYSDDLSI